MICNDLTRFHDDFKVIKDGNTEVVRHVGKVDRAYTWRRGGPLQFSGYRRRRGRRGRGYYGEDETSEDEESTGADTTAGAALPRQFSDRTITVLADQVSSGTALLRATSLAEKARPAVSLTGDLSALWDDLASGGALAATADIVLTGADGAAVQAHAAVGSASVPEVPV